jgi:putative membrane protein
MSVFMMVGWVLGALLLVVLAVVLIRVLLLGDWSNTRQTPRPDSALHTLEERYARGEIGHEEFEERRRVLDPEQKVRGGGA